MTDKVRIGVIGLGIMGEQYVRIYRAHSSAIVTAICTRRREQLDQIGDKYQIEDRYTDFSELLERADVRTFAHVRVNRVELWRHREVLRGER